MKKKRINLSDIAIKSFVTEQKQVKGGCPVHTDTIQPCTLPAQCFVETIHYTICNNGYDCQIYDTNEL